MLQKKHKYKQKITKVDKFLKMMYYKIVQIKFEINKGRIKLWQRKTKEEKII